MDLITHALTGALVAASPAPTDTRRTAALVGGVAGCLPDIDVLIRSSTDPLLVLEYHRHFTHSLFFSPFGAALAALLLWPFLRRRLGWGGIFAAALAGYVSACLLDACTSYGTHLFWPLVQQPIALNLIAVVDPAFTLLVLVGLVLTLRRQSLWRWMGVAAGGLYLGIGAMQLHRAQSAAQQWTQAESVPVQEILAKPTMGNLLLWRVLISDGESVQAIAVRAGLHTTIYVGETAKLLDPKVWQLPESSRAYRDIQRFYRFSNGYMVAVPDRADQVGDVRYAMLPTLVTPLWGIEIDRQNPDSATEFFTRRDTSQQVRSVFLHMLVGRPNTAATAP